MNNQANIAGVLLSGKIDTLSQRMMVAKNEEANKVNGHSLRKLMGVGLHGTGNVRRVVIAGEVDHDVNVDDNNSGKEKNKDDDRYDDDGSFVNTFAGNRMVVDVFTGIVKDNM
jgi:hypothetical protein